jgi:hypothetical protein
MKLRALSLILAVLIAVFIFSGCELMQRVENTCSVAGTVYVNGKPFPQPQVMAYDAETGKAIAIHNDQDQLIGRENGYYAVRGLTPGEYILKVRSREGRLLTKEGEEPIVNLKLGRIEERDIYIDWSPGDR